MYIGILFFGAVCQIVGALIVERQGFFARSLWFGIAFAFAAATHMYRTIERALNCGADARTLVVRGYFFRYAMIAAALAVVAVTGVMNPLIVFLGYMSLKVTAYIQPLTHKLCNILFHETDPVPEPLEEASVSGKEERSPFE